MLDIKNRDKIARTFGSASDSYDVSARLQRYSGKHLMPWLPNRNDLTVVDLGCGTGFFTDILASQYQQVFGIDISTKMLNFSKENRNKSIVWLEADANHLPFQDQSVDLIYSNLVIQWCDPIEKVINEILRVLKPGGLFIFTTLTEGTLYELRSSWRQVDDDQHVNEFLPEKSLINAFNNQQAILLEHSVQDIVLEYENVLHLARELKGLGASRVPNRNKKGLSGKESWQKMSKAYQDFQEPNGVYPATYRVFSGLMTKLSV